jgi:hypothetical protein
VVNDVDIIRKAQIAAQIVAVMQADFCRPSKEEMSEILIMAMEQVKEPTQPMTPATEEESLALHR